MDFLIHWTIAVMSKWCCLAGNEVTRIVCGSRTRFFWPPTRMLSSEDTARERWKFGKFLM